MLPADNGKHFPTHQNPGDHTKLPVAEAELQNWQLLWSGLFSLQTNEVSIRSKPTILEANEEKNELKRLFDEAILLTQASSNDASSNSKQD